MLGKTDLAAFSKNLDFEHSFEFDCISIVFFIILIYFFYYFYFFHAILIDFFMRMSGIIDSSV